MLLEHALLDNITTNRNISIEELREDGNLIIYIVDLILLIVWKVTVICQVCLHRKHNRLEKLVKSQRYQIPWRTLFLQKLMYKSSNL